MVQFIHPAHSVEITSRGINKDISVDADIINVGATATRQITYSITEGNDDGFFKINNEGVIQLAKSLAQGRTSIYTLVVTATITGDDAEEKTATITIAINNDNASIAISLTNSSIAIGVAIGDVVGTLSATNIDGNLSSTRVS
ncbi:cadherin domain-containing protein [Bathymodiolus thermophilus thioautotrophic gill symbiont]|uniref:cadherin domain-containing protein n=1 Tax=Bathymodiolus thermophilus thioautotrophic gill symbiont TaxID=2360 RepID=UPI00192AECB2